MTALPVHTVKLCANSPARKEVSFNIIQEEKFMKNKNDTLIKEIITKQIEELQVTQTDLLSQLHTVIQQDCTEEGQFNTNDRVQIQVHGATLIGYITKITKRRAHVKVDDGPYVLRALKNISRIHNEQS